MSPFNILTELRDLNLLPFLTAQNELFICSEENKYKMKKVKSKIQKLFKSDFTGFFFIFFFFKKSQLFRLGGKKHILKVNLMQLNWTGQRCTPLLLYQEAQFHPKRGETTWVPAHCLPRPAATNSCCVSLDFYFTIWIPTLLYGIRFPKCPRGPRHPNTVDAQRRL